MSIFRPDLFLYEDVLNMDNETRLNHAFDIAEKELEIDRLLDPEGIFILFHILYREIFLDQTLNKQKFNKILSWIFIVLDL